MREGVSWRERKKERERERERESARKREPVEGSQSVQHGYVPIGRHEKPELCSMDESSILRRRGLQVGKWKLVCVCGEAVL